MRIKIYGHYRTALIIETGDDLVEVTRVGDRRRGQR